MLIIICYLHCFRHADMLLLRLLAADAAMLTLMPHIIFFFILFTFHYAIFRHTPCFIFRHFSLDAFATPLLLMLIRDVYVDCLITPPFSIFADYACRHLRLLNIEITLQSAPGVISCR